MRPFTKEQWLELQLREQNLRNAILARRNKQLEERELARSWQDNPDRSGGGGHHPTEIERLRHGFATG